MTAFWTKGLLLCQTPSGVIAWSRTPGGQSTKEMQVFGAKTIAVYIRWKPTAIIGLLLEANLWYFWAKPITVVLLMVKGN